MRTTRLHQPGRPAPMRSFALELRVHPRPEPGLFLAPLQPFGEQNLADPAALHANALLAQVGHQAVQRPRRKRQTQLGGPGQRRSNNSTALLGGINRRAPRAHVLLQPREAALVEALEPEAHRRAAQAHPGRNLRCTQAVNRVLDDLRTAHQPGPERARARHSSQLRRFLLAQGAHPDGHRHAPAQTHCRPQRARSGKVTDNLADAPLSARLQRGDGAGLTD